MRAHRCNVLPTLLQISQTSSPAVFSMPSLECVLPHVGLLEANFHCHMFDLAREINVPMLEMSYLYILSFPTISLVSYILEYYTFSFFSYIFQSLAHWVFCLERSLHLTWCLLALKWPKRKVIDRERSKTHTVLLLYSWQEMVMHLNLMAYWIFLSHTSTWGEEDCHGNRTVHHGEVFV